VVQLPVQAAFRFSQGLPPLYYLQAIWMLLWILVGYVIQSAQGHAVSNVDNTHTVPHSL
jgi:hypothetical protein